MDIGEVVSPEKLKDMPLFEHLPYKFLTWNSEAVIRRRLARKEVLFHEGEYGSTAFILTAGRLICGARSSPWHSRTTMSPAGVSDIVGHRAAVNASRVEVADLQWGGRATAIPSETGAPRTLGNMRFLSPDHGRVIGEAACLNGYHRAETAIAFDDSEVLEFGRHVVLAMLRHPPTRRAIRENYRSDALIPFLKGLPLFKGIAREKRARFAKQLCDAIGPKDFQRVQPRQVIFREGDPADFMCLVRVGFIKVTAFIDGGDVILDYIGPGGVFGELGLVVDLAQEKRKEAEACGKEDDPMLVATFEELKKLENAVPRSKEPGMRLTTCSAVDHADVVIISKEVFKRLIDSESGLLPLLVNVCREQIEKYWADLWSDAVLLPRSSDRVASELNAGVANARQLLVLDLDRCTRCDECTKACADSHEGVTRLIREGKRHGNFLVATSCHSCMTPYCMKDCPVNSIHRGIEREIVIEPWCIGCGSCASHCPYDNIRMVDIEVERDDPDHPGRKVARLDRQATTCDLCRTKQPPNDQPSCVFACPHDAAFRMNGNEFREKVKVKAAVDPPDGAGRSTNRRG
jgi:Fe-S-cluster-containing hydrogenase component 2/CRP-like cAMP-binding protein